MLFHIGVNARREHADRWGEFDYVRFLAADLNRLGHGTRQFFRDERPKLTGREDVVLNIVGPHIPEPIPNAPNFLWIISKPNYTSMAMLRRYQRVFCASKPVTDVLVGEGVSTIYLPQATNPDFFNPDRAAKDGPRYRFAFVGKRSARALRPNVLNAINRGFPVMVWGSGWEKDVPPECFGGPYLDAEELAEVYARSDVILNDHQPDMSDGGFMSNRTFDALASGAQVVTNQVLSFQDANLKGLFIAQGPGDFLAKVAKLAKAPPARPEMRASVAQAVCNGYTFALRAKEISAQATNILKLAEHPPGIRERIAGVMAEAGSVAPIQESDPSSAREGESAVAAMGRIAWEIICIGAQALENGPFTTPEPLEKRQGVINAIMADLRDAQKLARNQDHARNDAAWNGLLERACRIVEALPNSRKKEGGAARIGVSAEQLIRIANNRPLFDHTPPGLSRDGKKHHVILWPKRSHEPVTRQIGIVLHLYYVDLAKTFAEKLSGFPLPHRIYVSTDTEEKAATIRLLFPEADIRVFQNRGRDICPMLCAFGPLHEEHDVILKLHGKKSTHSKKLDSWLQLSLDCLLPPPDEIKRIHSFFRTIPEIGIVSPVLPKIILSAVHWGENYDIAREISYRLGYDEPLPDAAALDFPAGSMFWARTDVLRPLFDLRLDPVHFPRDFGQVDATTAHAIERLFGVVCSIEGYRMIRVASPSNGSSKSFKSFGAEFSRNGELREALRQGLARDGTRSTASSAISK